LRRFDRPQFDRWINQAARQRPSLTGGPNKEKCGHKYGVHAKVHF
jgi:hypothetical protein